MTAVDFSPDEINLLLSSIGMVLNIVTDPAARQQLLALQAKLMAARGDEDD
jgi:hypothetical protein